MKKSINLTSKRQRVESVLRKVFFASVVAFLITILVSFMLIAYRLLLKSNYDTLDQKQQALSSKILAMTDKKDKYIETKSRLADIRKILGKRASMTVKINTLSDVVPADVTLNSISGDNTLIQLNVKSQNLSSLNNLIEQKIIQLAKSKNKQIQKITMNSFGLNPKTLEYVISFGVSFK